MDEFIPNRKVASVKQLSAGLFLVGAKQSAFEVA